MGQIVAAYLPQFFADAIKSKETEPIMVAKDSLLDMLQNVSKFKRNP